MLAAFAALAVTAVTPAIVCGVKSWADSQGEHHSVSGSEVSKRISMVPRSA
jgi:hypothetical protein